jgi:hypothetical protein
MNRIAVFDNIPAAATRRAFLSATSIQAVIQKKIYGTSVMITDIVASASKRLETRRRNPLTAHPTTSAFTSVPYRLRFLIFGMENLSERVWRIREVAII